MTREYDPQELESRWQAWWEEHGTFDVDLAGSDRPKFYMLAMYPYPSGALHTGHVMEYTIGDLIARHRRMMGFDVLYPMGWDSFGLPAENAAIRRNIPPAEFTYGNIDKMRAQMRRAGWSVRWESELATSDPEYYHWNQWIFLRMLERGLAYRKASAVNWCPMCQTVLANEQVVDGLCERHGVAVTRRHLEQWFVGITEYAQRMLDEFEEGWDPKVIAMQQAWIGRSEGARIEFEVEGKDARLGVFTTRPDTLHGVTFVSLAPEHPLVNELVAGTKQEAEVHEFVERTLRTPAYLRGAEGGEKEGVFTGHWVRNPVNGERAQLWVSNYALMEYGTGAVMAVPAHDQRDFEFARKYGLPVKVVIQPEGEELIAEALTEAYTGDGLLVASGAFTGQQNRAAIPDLILALEAEGRGERTVSYRLRDWLVSRQRYWGTPIPVIYCDPCGVVPVPDDQLPVRLPEGVDFRPTGRSPLATVEEFVNTTCPKCGGPARRETDTMDTFVDSSWYFFRYLSPKDDSQIVNRERVERWFPVDQYIGGIEHANGHLVFSRFMTKFLADIGVQPFPEYAKNMFTHGMICMVSHHCKNHSWLHRDDVVDGACKHCGEPVTSELAKMSKTKLNTVDPDELFATFGADTVRLYAMFMGPPDKSTEYNPRGVIGANRFLRRLFQLVVSQEEALVGVQPYQGDGEGLDAASRDILRVGHQTIEKVTGDYQSFAFNTAVAAIMGFTNEINAKKDKARPDVLRWGLETVVTLLYPMTPHICEELWLSLGHQPSLQAQPWPTWDPALTKAESIEVVFQVNGSIRGRAQVEVGTDDETLKALALAHEGVQRILDGRTPRRMIVVKERLVNVVV